MSQQSKPYFEAFHNRLNFIYDCSCEDCNSQKQQINLSLSDDFKSIINIGKLAYKKLFENGKYNPKDLKTVKEYQDLIDENYKILNFAIQDNDMPEVMRTALQNDAFMFGGLKTHAQLTEVSQLLLNSDGKQKSFSEVQNDFNKLNLQYNQNYLQSEYQFATSSAQMASKWSQLDNTGRYNLQYRTAGDSKVRAEHAALRDITLPKDDPFWDSFCPPNGWKCRCTAVEVLKDKYPLSDSAKSIDAGNKATTQIGKDGKNRLEIFRFNPGATQKLMPPKHPYNANRCSGDGKLSITGLIGAPKFVLSLEADRCEASRIIAEIRAENSNRFTIIKKFDNGGSIAEHSLLNVRGSDYENIKSCCKSFAKNGDVTEILPKVHSRSEAYKVIYKDLIGTKYEGKCPDFRVNGNYYELEGFENAGDYSKMLGRGLKQSSRIVLEKTSQTESHLKKLIKFRINENIEINEIWILDNTKLNKFYPNKTQ